MNEENKELNENNKKIEIVSADLLNPFGNIKQSNLNENKNDIKESKIINNISEISKDKNNDFYGNVKEDTSKSTLNENIGNNKENNSKSDDFYSNFETSKASNNSFSSNNNDVININKNVTSDLPDRKTSVPFIVTALLGFGLQFLNGYFVIIGFVLCIISFICSIIMYRKLAKYALLSIILSIIFIIVSVLMYILVYKKMDNLLDNSKITVFKDEAKSYINAAYMDILKNKTISCDGINTSIKYKLNELKEYYSSPTFEIDDDNSYVLIEAVMENDNCVFKKYIYIKYKNYTLGTLNNPILEENINSSKVIEE